MEFVESFKLTDIERVEKEGLDRKLLADRVADSFLSQILKTGYFHCDPHPGAPRRTRTRPRRCAAAVAPPHSPPRQPP